jgi:type IV pilus assembly protein PilW
MRGFGLIELMVSLAIGLVMIAAMLAVYIQSNSASSSNRNTSELVNNGRYALDTLKSDLRQAGFLGFTNGPPDPRNAPLSTVITPISNECLQPGATAGAFVANIWQRVWGADDSNPFATGANCLTDYAGGDVLVVRRLEATPASTLAANTFYFRSHYSGGELYRGAPATACDSSLFPAASYPAPFNKAPCIPGKAGVDLLNFPVVTHVYYIRKYSVASTESPKIPGLVRVSLQSDGALAAELIASGIENLQIQYARARTDASSQYLDASAISGNSYLSATPSMDWDDVNSVRIWLLARNTAPETGYANTTRYAMGNSGTTVADSYRRQLFSSVVNLRNNQQ